MTIAAGAISQLPVGAELAAKRKPPLRRQMAAKPDIVAQPEPR